MISVLTPAEMAAADAAAPEPLAVLVERAGAAVAHHALDLMGGGYGRRVVVVAGKGSNGADGRAAAERLRRRGARVVVLDAAAAPAALPAAHLVIDAAYGTGFRGSYVAPDPGGAEVLAVDIPSGVDGVTGEERGTAMPARRTVTFAALKPGLLLEPGRALAGEVVVVDIGLAVGPSTAAVVERADVAACLPARPADAHKWNRALLVVAGSVGMTGAAHLTAAAAQRTGAGMVWLATPGEPDPSRPVEVVAVPIPATDWGPSVLAAAARFDAVVVGPGLGRSPSMSAAVHQLLRSLEGPVVVDGDALSALGTDVAVVLARRPGPTVLTPHAGELAALVGRDSGADRVEVARRLAAASGAVVLLKGATTVIADPTGAVRFVTIGDARLATAGTGDVLSGVLGALLADGVPAFDAAAAAAWLHARAANLGAGPGLVAGDVIERLPTALLEVWADGARLG